MATKIDARSRRPFRHDGHANNQQLSAKERERLLQPYLPEPPSDISSPAVSPNRNARRASRTIRKQKSLRSRLAHYLYVVVFAVTHAVFSVWFRFRRFYRFLVHRFYGLYYYHHRTPEYIKKDVAPLNKLPEHVSVILDLNESDDDQGSSGLEGLVQDVCDIAAWTASAGIPMLSVYEQTGVLKNYMPQLHEAITSNLASYFGNDRKPILTLRAPLIQAFSPPATPPEGNTRPSSPEDPEPLRITVLLLSATDGRDTMVDLTKTLADMAQKKSIEPNDITTELINMELKDAVSGEPDLLILFSPRVVLKGYPPWQVRLTEIYHVPDNVGVNYPVFLRALYNFAKAEIRFGRMTLDHLHQLSPNPIVNAIVFANVILNWGCSYSPDLPDHKLVHGSDFEPTRSFLFLHLDPLYGLKYIDHFGRAWSAATCWKLRKKAPSKLNRRRDYHNFLHKTWDPHCSYNLRVLGLLKDARLGIPTDSEGSITGITDPVLSVGTLSGPRFSHSRTPSREYTGILSFDESD